MTVPAWDIWSSSEDVYVSEVFFAVDRIVGQMKANFEDCYLKNIYNNETLGVVFISK